MNHRRLIEHHASITNGGAVASGPSYADDFISAASIVDSTEIAALEQLELDLLGTGSTTNNSELMSKMIAVYPISPTSLSASSYNFVDPSSYQITWYNSPTHTTAGVAGDRVTVYGDTGIAVQDLSSTNCGLTSRGNMSGSDFAMGYYDATADGIYLRESAFFLYVGGDNAYPVETTAKTSPFLTTGVTRSASDREVYLNGSSEETDTSTDSYSFSGITETIYVLACNNNGTDDFHNGTAGVTSFIAVHQGLTDNEVQDFADAIETYNANVIGGGR